jgi:hypothetical protein
LDYDSTPVGVDFRNYIKGVFDDCDILLAIIGPHWRGDDGTGKPRIVHDDDWVRIEIETALKKNIPVVPVLIDRTPMPSKDALPEEVRDLVYRQAAVIDTQIDFNSHMDRLIRQIDRLLGVQSTNVKVPPAFAGTFGELDNDRSSTKTPTGSIYPKILRPGFAYTLAFISICIAAVALWIYFVSQKKSPLDPAYAVYSSPDLGVTVVFPNNIFTLDTTERKQRRLALRDGEGRPLIRILRTALPEPKDVKIGRKQEVDELTKMDYTLTYVAPENEKTWTNWYVISGVKHGTEFYFRRWYSEDSVVSMEFIYPKELAPLFDKLIPTMTHELAFTSVSPKIDPAQ